MGTRSQAIDRSLLSNRKPSAYLFGDSFRAVDELFFDFPRDREASGVRRGDGQHREAGDTDGRPFFVRIVAGGRLLTCVWQGADVSNDGIHVRRVQIG